MKNDDARDFLCAYEEGNPKHDRPLYPLFEQGSVVGRGISGRYARTFFGGGSPFSSFSTTRLFLVTAVHVVGVPAQHGGFRPIVNQAWIDAMFRVANEIWSQACVELVPYFTGELVTDFFGGGIGVSGSISCLSGPQLEMVRPHDITTPGRVVINVYLADELGQRIGGCGDPFTGHVLIATSRGTPDRMGNVFAHEIGHVLLNPLGVDDSDQPNHLMFHAARHPEIPVGSRDGLFLSDCIGAQTRAREELFSFARPGGLGNPGEAIACQMSPKLGNNLVLVAT